MFVPCYKIKVFYLFDFKKDKPERIRLSDEFIVKYDKYLKKNCLPYRHEDIVSFYYMSEGWSIERNYLLRKEAGYPDLTIKKGDVVEHIEVKSDVDQIKYRQLRKLLELDAKVMWVLPIEFDCNDERNVRDLMY